MEIIGQISDPLLICVNNGSATSLTLAFSNDNESGGGDSFRQLFLLNLDSGSGETGPGGVPASMGPTTSKNVKPPQNLHPLVFLPVPSTNSHIIHASLQKLDSAPANSAVGEFFAGAASDGAMYSLMTVVTHRLKQEPDDSTNSYYSVVLYLLETKTDDHVTKGKAAAAAGHVKTSSKTIIIERFEPVKEQRQKLHAHVMPCSFEPGTSAGGALLTPASSASDLTNVCQRFVNRILVLHLQEGFTIFRVETTPCSSRDVTARISNRIELLSSECIPKPFWWAQWNPGSHFLAFTHRQKLRQSPSMEFPAESSRQIGAGTRKRVLDMGTLSVYQLHSTYPRESVLNFPLPKYEEEILTSKQEFFKPTCALEFSPFVLASAPPTPQQQLRVLTNSTTGTVYVFQLLPTTSGSGLGSPNEPSEAHVHDNDKPAPVCKEKDTHFVKYVVHILHHNRSLSGKVICQPNLIHGAYHVRVDVCLIKNGQFLVIVGWPLFVHVLDVGADHEPSHHLIFSTNSALLAFLPASVAVKEPSTISLAMVCAAPAPSLATTTATVAEHSFQIVFNLVNVNNNLQVQNVQLNSSFILPLLPKSDTQFQMSALHFLMIHANDLNAVKRMIYNGGQSSENMWLSKLFQEFLVSHSYVLTRKQMQPSTKRFLHLLPYCPILPVKEAYEGTDYKLEVQPGSVQVSNMLLSPSQRIFPHTVTDLWTALWELSDFLTKNKRFSHKTIADKLLISLQCYKPEVLSRATTPMSPSSPMIWSSAPAFGIGGNGSCPGGTGTGFDLASPFGSGKRGQEPCLQLPFLEHESCTANKQEYVYSINLRELSMHLLKERKDCPIHGHTVGGRYVNSLVETSRLLCMLICQMVNLPAMTTAASKAASKAAKDKGFRLIDSLTSEAKLRLFLLFEHYSLAVAKLACPLPNGFTSFFAYLGYRVLQYDQFLWHIRSGTFDLQIDLIKMIMADLSDSDKANIDKKLRLISLLSKSRAGRVLNGWNHPKAVCIRARQHSADLLAGNVVSNARRGNALPFSTHINRIRHRGDTNANSNSSATTSKSNFTPLGTFFSLLAAKANPGDIDLALLTEATMLSMNMDD